MTKILSLLAQSAEHPDGETATGLELSACLTPNAQLDPAAFQGSPLPWPVRRTWPDHEEWHGELIRVDEGWAIRAARGDNEPVWDVAAKIMRPGEYITLRRPDGEELIFRIVGVE
jgi:hypothetical protein